MTGTATMKIPTKPTSRLPKKTNCPTVSTAPFFLLLVEQAKNMASNFTGDSVQKGVETKGFSQVNKQKEAEAAAAAAAEKAKIAQAVDRGSPDA